MANCVRSCCSRLVGPRQHDVSGAPPLLEFGAAPPDSAAIETAGRAASRGLRQLRCLRHQCEALAPSVGAAAFMAPSASSGGEVALASIHARIAELEELFEAAIAAGAAASRPSPAASWWGAARAGPQVREVASCLAAEGADRTWRPGRIVLSNAGLSFDRGSEPASGSVELVPWGDVAGVSMREPLRPGPARALATDDASGSLLYEADLDLRRPPGRLRLQFGSAQPVRVISSLWQEAIKQGRGPTLLAEPTLEFPESAHEMADGWVPLLALLRAGDGSPTCEVELVFQGSLTVGAAKLAQLRTVLLRSDTGCAIEQFWGTQGVTEFKALTPWGPMGCSGDRVRCFHFQLPLKPMPMAPKSTRLSIVYCLKGNSGDERHLVLTEMSKALDVPYSSCFTVQSQAIFSEVSAAEAGSTIHMEKRIGLAWSRRCMVKGMVEGQARSECKVVSADMLRILSQNLRASLENGRG